MLLRSLIELVENGRIPDLLTRAGIRLLLLQRLREQAQEGPDQEWQAMMTFVEEMQQSPIALHTQEANEQHYELPPQFFELVLGPHLKYSCCHFPEGVKELGHAEASMLALTCERAQLQDGQQILELGCGWGSLSPYGWQSIIQILQFWLFRILGLSVNLLSHVPRSWV